MSHESYDKTKTNRIFFVVSKSLIFLTFVVSFVVITFASVVYLHLNRNSISDVLSEYNSEEDDIFWAKEILNGGYILHFRHAERDKWIDVQMYDALESDLHANGVDDSRYAENDYFSEAVCLNDRGKIQAKAMGEHLANINLPIGLVVSSVSCRARQTAVLAFGGYDSLHRILVHKGPYNETKKHRVSSLVDFYNDLPVSKETNTVVSAHNGVIHCDMFENYCDNPSLEEGGFYVITKRPDGLYLEHEFHNYNRFNKVFYDR